jgi:RNA polymerase sigma factor (sigma-70 family)
VNYVLGRVTVKRDDSAAPDEELVARCLDGDEAAWSALVRRHGPVVWGVTRKAGLDESDASDVHQIVWRIAVQDLARVRHPERIGHWLARTAYLQTMRRIRDRMTWRRVYRRITPPEADATTPDDIVQTVEDRRTVRTALRRIDERCRRLLELLYYESPRPSYAQIGSFMDMPVGSIGPTRARCLSRLEDLIGGDLDDA